MLHEETMDFLRQTPPFQFVERAALRRLADEAILEFYPAGAEILSGKRQKNPFLYIIKKGLVQIDAISTARRLGPGELFGMPAGNDPATAQAPARATADTLCYLVELCNALDAIEDQPELDVFFNEKLDNVYFERAANDIYAKSLAAAWAGASLRSLTAAEALVEDFPSAPMNTSIFEAAKRMTALKQSAIILHDAAERPVGIITDADLRAKVVAAGVDPNQPASTIMASPVIEVAASDSCFDALMLMSRHNIHHVLATDGTTCRGVLSYHDLMVVQGGSPLAFVEKIQSATTLTSLSEIAIQLDTLAARLLRGGASAAALTRIVSELHERLMARLVEFGVDALGQPPAPFAFLVFGDQARRETALRSQQHNGLVYTAPERNHDHKGLAEYFRILSIFVRDGLAALGFPTNPNGRVAADPAWRLPLDDWKRFYAQTLPKSLAAQPDLAAFLDIRAVYGDANLAESLRAFLLEQARASAAFRAGLAASVHHAPLRGLVGQALETADGQRLELLDVAAHCLAPIAAWVRVVALAAGLDRVSTLERLRVLAGCHPLVQNLRVELSSAVEYSLLLGAYHGLEYARSGLPRGAAPAARLSALEKRTLNLIFRLQERLTPDAVALTG